MEERRTLMIAEDAANFITHAVSVPAVVYAFLNLQLHARTSAHEFFVLSVYGWIMLTLFTVSAIYHLTCLLAGIYPDGKFYNSSRNFLRAADRSVIHLFIAACYTPWLLLRFHTPLAEGICKVVWICAIVCMIAQNVPTNLRIVQDESFVIGSYLMLGVMPGTFLCAFATDTDGLLSIAEGGFLYIAGLIFYFLEGKFPFAHAIWHLFVNSGAYAHYSALNCYLLRERSHDRSWLSWFFHTWFPSIADEHHQY